MKYFLGSRIVDKVDVIDDVLRSLSEDLIALSTEIQGASSAAGVASDAPKSTTNEVDENLESDSESAVGDVARSELVKAECTS